MSTAPHLWKKLLEARSAGARLVVVDPFRSRTARVADEHLRPLPGTDAALALGMMRAVLDAGLVDEEWCRAHADGFDELVERLGERTGRRVRGHLRCGRRRRSSGSAATSRQRSPRCFAWESGPSVTSARRSPTARSPACRRSRAPGGTAAAVARTSPRRPPVAVPSAVLDGAELRTGPSRDDQHVAAGRGPHRRGARSAGQGTRRLVTRIRPRSRPTRSACSRASGATTCTPS